MALLASAVRAAADAQRAVAAEGWPEGATPRVRMGLHLGDGRLRRGAPGDPEDYVGIDVNYAARIAAARRQALVLGVFLTGDFEGALELEGQNLAEFRALGSEYQVADSMTFHAGVYLKSGDPQTSWKYVLDGLRWFAENDNQSGIARALGMAAIVLLTFGDAELGARAAGATYLIVREKGVMLAPVKVIHMRDPEETAIEGLGEERARELMTIGSDTPIGRVIEEVLAAPGPGAA